MQDCTERIFKVTQSRYYVSSRNKTISIRHQPQFREYNIIRTHKKDAILGGGTAILIRKRISFLEISLDNIDTKILESSAIKIKINTSNSLYIISAYSPKFKGTELAIEIKKFFLSRNCTRDKTITY